MQSETSNNGGVLNERCETLLHAIGNSSFPCDSKADEGFAQILDDQGNFVVKVSMTISDHDLLTILKHGQQEYKRGFKDGEKNMQARLRDLIGLSETI